jgi:hypothetical protein
MFDFKAMELERIRKNHDFKMQKMQLKADLQTKEENLKNRLESNKLNNRKGQLGLLDDIRMAKMVVSNDKKIIRTGKALDLWATIGTIVSTLLTIAGLWHFYNTSILKSISFILAIIMTQFTVYFLAKQTSNINKHFIQHAFKCSLLKFTLLAISIYGNYTFFTSSRSINFVEFVTTLALCICIDVISIYVLSVAQDFKTLNKNCFKAKIQNNNSIVSKIKEIIIAIPENYINRLHRKVVKNTYLVNEIKDTAKLPHDRIINSLEVKQEAKKPVLTLVKSSNSVMDKSLDRSIESSNNKKNGLIKSARFGQTRNTEIILEYIVNNQKNGVVPSSRQLEQNTGLTNFEVREAKKELKEMGYIETLKNKTYLKKQREEAGRYENI